MNTVLPTLETPKSLNEQVFEALSNAIVQLGFEPGQPLVTVDLAEQLGVSRTPVRVALGQLEQLGLVQSVEGQGYVVAPLSLEDLENLYALREVLEGLAARLAAERVSEDRLVELNLRVEEMRNHLRHSNNLNDLQQSESFHQLIVEAARNDQLVDALRRISLHIQRYRLMALTKLNSEELRDGVTEHRAVLEAICAHDARLAEQQMREHIVHARDRLISRWKSSGILV